MSRTTYRIVLVVLLLAATGVACSSLSDAGERIDSAAGTAQSLATNVREGGDLLGTAQNNEVVMTARAYATQEGSKLLETARAFATEEGPGLVATAQAFATQEGSGLAATLQAFATREGPEALGTMQAQLTQVAPSGQQNINDIPVLEGPKENQVVTPTTVGYVTPSEYTGVKDFYQTAMVRNGWVAVPDGTMETGSAAILNFQKSDRKATVILSVDQASGGTAVLVHVQPR